MTRAIEHRSAQHCFFYEEQGHQAYLEYTLQDKVLSITHTWVPAPLGGQGIAADLTRAALAYAQDNHWTVRPVCSYAARFIERNQEYQPLLAPTQPE